MFGSDCSALLSPYSLSKTLSLFRLFQTFEGECLVRGGGVPPLFLLLSSLDIHGILLMFLAGEGLGVR
jgi:hypothetical protein